MEIEASFYMTDVMNPSIGYTLKIKNTITGEPLIHGTIDPASGLPLLTNCDCFRVIDYYLYPEIA